MTTAVITTLHKPSRNQQTDGPATLGSSVVVQGQKCAVTVTPMPSHSVYAGSFLLSYTRLYGLKTHQGVGLACQPRPTLCNHSDLAAVSASRNRLALPASRHLHSPVNNLNGSNNCIVMAGYGHVYRFPHDAGLHNLLHC